MTNTTHTKSEPKIYHKMEWAQFLTIVLSVFAMGWMIVFNITSRIDKLNENIAKDSRDFHGRLCALEEKYRQIGGK